MMGLLLGDAVAAAATGVAAAPPRGWNSYDSYTWKVSERAFLDNCMAMASRLKKVGYDFCVVDYLWFQDLDAVPGAAKNDLVLRDPITRMHIDEYGRLQPAPDRWPSAWAADGTSLGFKPIADKVHAMGSTTEPFTTLVKTEPAGDVAWNFEKFLVGRDGTVISRFKSGVSPDDLKTAIEAALAS